ncbi:MAG: hypothetical protein U9R19_01300 [Bacteroidota bacterium]|nr:hypothetical protein [Bacteroidota bacterium]
MKKLFLFLILITALFSSCKNELVKRITSTFKSGLPEKIEYYKIEGDTEVLVKHVIFYKTGEKRLEGGFLGNERNGTWSYWHENGNKWSEGNFSEGISHGKTTVWYDNGKKHYTGNFVDGKTDGKWTYWAIDGAKVKEVYFKNGKKISEESFE